MNSRHRAVSIVMVMTLLLASVFAQSQSAQLPSPQAKKKVNGNGTPGRVTRWTGTNTLGDSNITEDNFGRIGIGINPTSPLTVNGLIETRGAQGGIRFPDGTVQTTAVSPFGLAIPINLTGSAAGGIIEAVNSNGVGLFGRSTINDGVVGFSARGVGVRGFSETAIGVSGLSNGTDGLAVGLLGRANLSNTGTGVLGESTNGFGVVGRSVGEGPANGNGTGVLGSSTNGVGVFGFSVNLNGVTGETNSTRAADAGILGRGRNGGAFAGRFFGNVNVTGRIEKGGGSFKIDHPLDPENKYLSHSFVESPDMMNIYNGNITTDHQGFATVELPEWFEALNSDFRYQLTVVGQFAQAIVAEKVKGNRFTIQTNVPGVEVSWQVTGIRQDAWANKNRIPVEEKKSRKERGFYLHPEAFDKEEERGIEWAHNPEMMRQLKQRRAEAEQSRHR